MELGLAYAKTQSYTVEVLRELIRQQREVSKCTGDPRDQLPVGLSRLKLEDLKVVVLSRNLPLPDKATRPQLFVLIRDDVEARNLLYSGAATNPEEQQTSSTSGPSNPHAMDWVDLSTPRQPVATLVKRKA